MLVVIAWSAIFALLVFSFEKRFDRDRRHTVFVVMTESTTEKLNFGGDGQASGTVRAMVFLYAFAHLIFVADIVCRH